MKDYGVVIEMSASVSNASFISYALEQSIRAMTASKDNNEMAIHITKAFMLSLDAKIEMAHDIIDKHEKNLEELNA